MADLGDVRVGLAVIPAQEELIAGIIVEFEEIHQARAFSQSVVNYFESKSDRSFTVAINRRKDVDVMRINIQSAQGELAIDVDSVDAQIRSEVVASLKRHPSYFLLLAERSSGETIFLPAQENGIYKSDIVIDGEIVLGNRSGAWPVLNPVKDALES